MADERDKLRPKVAPPHVRAQTAQPDRKAPPYDPAAPAFEMGEFESKTPVFGDPLQRVEYRQKRYSQQMFALREKFDEMQRGQTSAVVTMTEVKTKSEVLAGMLEAMLAAQAEERKAREVREEARAADKAKQKTESRKITMSIIVPSITALGVGIAAIITAIMAAK